MNAILKQKPSAATEVDVPLRKEMGQAWVEITPEVAQRWLAFNTINRDMKRKDFERLCSDIEAGNWTPDGSTICFAHGKLLDGQHRLNAVVHTGVCIKSLVVWGLPADAQITKDTGRKRTAPDVFSIEGLEPWEARILGTAIHGMIAYDAGAPIYSGKMSTNKEARDFFLEHRIRIEETIRVVKSLPRHHPLVPHSRVALLHFALAKKDSWLATSFVDSLMTGAAIGKDTALFQVRNVLDSDRHSDRRRSHYDSLWMLVRAWNVFRKNKPLKSATSLYPRDGESFPEIA